MTTAAAQTAAPTAAETTAAQPGAGEPAAGGEAAPQPKPISKEFSVLARKEQSLQRVREAQKAKEQEIARREAEITRREQELQQASEKPKTPREALERFGWGIKDANEYELNDNQPTAEMIARQAVEKAEALQRRIDEDQKKKLDDAAQEAKAAEEATLAEFQDEIKTFVTENKEAYELTNLYDCSDLVFGVIDEHFTKTGKILSLKEAADLVETHLEAEVDKAMSTKKIGEKQGTPKPTPKDGTPSKPAQVGQVSAQRRTLSSDLTSSTPTLVHSSKVQEDAFSRALRKLEGG